MSFEDYIKFANGLIAPPFEISDYFAWCMPSVLPVNIFRLSFSYFT